MDPRRVFGNSGEDTAAKFLTGKGYKILARQFRTRFGEIDLIAENKGEIVFVEVKTRASLTAGHPEDSVYPKKLRRLQIAAEAYLRDKAWEEKPYRFDVIAITVGGDHDEILHLIGI